MTDADQIALWALNAAELLKRAIAKSAYPAADGTADIDNDAIPILAAALEHHHARGHTAGFNEAKERAVKVARAYGDSDASADIHNEPVDVAKGIETASRDIATALQAMKQGGSDD